MPRIEPYAIYNKNLNDLNENYKRREKALEGYGLSQEGYIRAVGQIRQEYDRMRFKFTTTKSQLDDIKRGMAFGQIDAISGQKAMWELVAPQETVAAMFPRQPAVSAVGVSPTGMASYVKRFETVREGMIKKVGPKWYKWDKKQAIPKEMVKRYFTERNIANLNDPRNAAKIPGFNQAFIQSMGEDERTADLIEKLLDPETGDPRMLAAFSPDSSMNRAFMRQFRTTKGVSPFARALQKERKKTWGWPTLTKPAYRVRPEKGEQSLPSVSTDADYDKLPSGVQYTDPQGNVRTKR